MAQDYAQDEAGNIWEVDAQGNPVRLVQAADAQPQNSVVSPNPLKASQMLREATRQAAADQREQARFEERNKPTLPAGYRMGPNGVAERIPGLPADEKSDPNTAATRATAIGAYKATQNLDGVIADIERLYREGPGSTKGLSGIQDYLPSPSNKRFDAAGNAARGAIIQALGFSSGQTNSPVEVEMNIGGYIPKAGDYDDVIQDKIRRLKELRNNAREKSIATLGGVPDANGRVTPVEQLSAAQYKEAFAGIANPPAPPPGGAGGGTAPPSNSGPTLGGPGRLLAPDEQVQFNGDAAPVTGRRMSQQQEAEILGAIRSGDEGQAVALLGRYGGGAVGPGEIASIRSTIAQVRKDPKTPVSFNYGKVDAFAQTEADRARFGDALAPAMDERANAPGLDVTARAAVNGLTGGLADYAAAGAGMLGGGTYADNLQRQKAITEADSRLNPGNTMVSNIVGGAGGAALTEGLAGALLPARAAAWAPRIGDAAYGLTAGATGSAPGQEASGALNGALGGVVGGMAGRGVARGVGNVARGARDVSADFLRERGVPLTVGQLVGRGGRVGQAVKGFEDRLSGIPVVGDMVNARRTESIEGLDRAAFDEGLAPINRTTGGVIGPEGVAASRQGVNQGYRDALDPVQMLVDQAFDTDNITAQVAGARLPQDMAGRAGYAIDRARENVDPNGVLTGRGFQQALRRLRRTSNENAPLPNGHDLGEVMNTAEEAYTGLLDRQAPGVMPQYLAANSANRHVSILKDAVNRARNGTRSGEPGRFTASQLNDAAAANARRFGGTEGTPEQPFYALGLHGQRVLPNSIPDSGTAGRLATLALPGILGGAGAGVGYAGGDAQSGTTTGLTAGALLALGGTRGGQRALTALLADRPDALVRIGDQINRRARVGGIFGAPLLAGSPVFQGQ